MGEIREPPAALLILAAISRHPDALDWAGQQATAAWGPIAMASDRFDFVETDYYDETMGGGLQKAFFAFGSAFDPATLAEVKLQTGTWEAAYTKECRWAESRPLNLDPGYLTAAKLVLASTKNHSHRLYLSRGIYAEVTLHYHDRRWQPREWTYPDYQTPEAHAWFMEVRDRLRGQHKTLEELSDGGPRA